MSVLTWKTRRGTLQRQSQVADAAMGYTTTWSALGSVAMRLDTSNSRIAERYKREGFENVVVVQTLDRLNPRIQGHTSLRDLLLDATLERMRIVYDGRTLTVVGVSLPNDGRIHGDQSVLNIACVETPQAVGIQDL